MASWAQKAAQPPVAAVPETDNDLANKIVAVVDANAIISMGSSIASLGDVLITTEETLAEVRDPSSRRGLELLPIQCRAPTASAIDTVATFARKTGDIHQLSMEDIRLLALTYMLETGVHGCQHIRSQPAPVTTHARQTLKGGLPGWGTNEESEEWDAIDAVGDTGAQT
jgi:RNA-binding protein NOB1